MDENVSSHYEHAICGRDRGCSCCTTWAGGTILLWLEFMWPPRAWMDENTLPHWLHCDSIWEILWLRKDIALLNDLSH